MKSKQATPRYAVRLVVLLAVVLVVFFGGLQLFVPDGSKLTGSYDAASLQYIAAAPLHYAGSSSCGASNCHEAIFTTWSQGAHGVKKEQSKCEVCHGPQGDHPKSKLLKVRGDGDVVKLCLTCHQKMKARKSTGQPQIEPQQHPYPHEGVLKCIQCHNPHSPGMRKTSPATADVQQADGGQSSSTQASLASGQPANAAADNDPAAQLANQCEGCHGSGGRGGFAPLLAGQKFEELKKKLADFKSGARKGSMMNTIAAPLKEQDMELLAKYFSSRS